MAKHNETSQQNKAIALALKAFYSAQSKKAALTPTLSRINQIEYYFYTHRVLEINRQQALIGLLNINETQILQAVAQEKNKTQKVLSSSSASSHQIRHIAIEHLFDKMIPTIIGPEGNAIMVLLQIQKPQHQPWLQKTSPASKNDILLNSLVAKLHKARQKQMQLGHDNYQQRIKETVRIILAHKNHPTMKPFQLIIDRALSRTQDFILALEDKQTSTSFLHHF